MAKQEIKWSLKAIHDKLDILEFWFNRNKSIRFSKRLDYFFDKAIEEIAIFPNQGKRTDFKDIRIKIVRSYLLYYLIKENSITILRVWDSRRDPKRIKLFE
jgi:plasmid stabilization system protein ParE